jgi:hypothetical protein
MSMSGPAGIGGFEEGEFEGDSPTEEVAAPIRDGIFEATLLADRDFPKVCQRW